jgi:glycosyltransferase involved in cell wall biosynthesis
VEEEVSPVEVFLRARKLFRDQNVDVAFLPSYSPVRYFALFAAAKSLGIRTVMMNESHAGTEQATGSAYALRVYGVTRRWIKRQIVKRFDAALVGGEPHKRHFASLGIPEEKIFTGYDAVDGDFFASRADEIRAEAKKSFQFSVFSVQQEEKADEVRSMERTLSSQRSQSRGSKEQDLPEAEHLSTLNSQPSTGQSFRSAYGLPQRYFLSLGRMVEKKNLSTLVEAYARFARASVERSKAETGNLKLEVSETADGAAESARQPVGKPAATKTENRKLNTAHCAPALVFVGSGELEKALREQARGLGLKVIDRTEWKVGQSDHSRACETAEGKLTQPTDRETALRQMDTDKSERLAADRTGGDASCRVTPAVGGLSPETADGEDAAATTAENCKLNTENSVENDRGAVYFYGFRQIEENAVFYALAEAFVLPSLKEEWGLVVNEAMAVGLPVIVSRTAGCAEDLVPEEPASRSMEHGAGGMESGENAYADDCKPLTDDSLEERSNGFAFDPRSSDALSEALRRIADCGTADGGAESARRPLGKPAATLKAVMGQRSREIVAKFSCENFARQALRAAEEASAP